jgi:hypothetical protein
MLYDWERRQRVLASHVIDDTPPRAPVPGLLGREEAASFRLVKLHGSIDTYWVPGDMSGATINRFSLPGIWGTPQPHDEEQRRRELPGRSAFIVPPASAKSAFYANPITREFWRSAAASIGQATILGLLGYSMPSTDLVATGMLAEQLSAIAQVHIVNYNATPILDRLNYLRIDPPAVDTYEGRTAISDYVDHIEEEMSRAAFVSMLNHDDRMRLVVAVTDRRAAHVTEVRPDEKRDLTLNIKVEPFTTLQDATRPRGDDEQEPVRLGALRAYMAHDRYQLSVVYPNGEVASIVNSLVWPEVINEAEWLILIPSAAPLPSARGE